VQVFYPLFFGGCTGGFPLVALPKSLPLVPVLSFSFQRFAHVLFPSEFLTTGSIFAFVP